MGTQVRKHCDDQLKTKEEEIQVIQATSQAGFAGEVGPMSLDILLSILALLCLALSLSGRERAES